MTDTNKELEIMSNNDIMKTADIDSEEIQLVSSIATKINNMSEQELKRYKKNLKSSLKGCKNKVNYHHFISGDKFLTAEQLKTIGYNEEYIANNFYEKSYKTLNKKESERSGQLIYDTKIKYSFIDPNRINQKFDFKIMAERMPRAIPNGTEIKNRLDQIKSKKQELTQVSSLRDKYLIESSINKLSSEIDIFVSDLMQREDVIKDFKEISKQMKDLKRALGSNKLRAVRLSQKLIELKIEAIQQREDDLKIKSFKESKSEKTKKLMELAQEYF